MGRSNSGPYRLVLARRIKRQIGGLAIDNIDIFHSQEKNRGTVETTSSRNNLWRSKPFAVKFWIWQCNWSPASQLSNIYYVES